MPRIPDYEAAGTSVARTNTPRFNDRSAQIREEGAQALAGSVNKVMERVVEHDDKMRYVAARGTLLRAQIEARKEFETDPDHETFEPRFRERMAKAQGEAGAKIRGGRSRAAFEADAQIDLERGVEQVRALARGVEVRQGIATMNDTLETNRNAALESKDPLERGDLLTNSYASVQTALERRYIDEAQAQQLTSKYRADYAEAFVGIQSPAERVEMLSKPDTNMAKHIAPDRRSALLEAAKKDNDEVRVRGESQAYFDEVMARHGTNFRGAFTEARAALKGDPRVRDAVETRISQEQVRVETFEREDREDAGEQAWKFVVDGGKVADLPLELKKRLKPADLVSLKNFATSGGRTVSDPETLVKLSILQSDQQNFADNVNMLEFRPLITDADFQQGLDLQRKIRTGSVDGKASGFLSVSQARDKKLIEYFGGATSKNKKVQAEINDFVSNFEVQQRAFREQHGKAPTTEDARKLMDQMWAEVVIKEGFLGSKKRAYQVTEEDVQVPTADREIIMEQLRSRGLPVTATEIERRYAANRAKRNAPLAPDPTSTTPLSDMVRKAEKLQEAKRKAAP